MLELKNVVKTYSTKHGKVEALKGVNFVFPQRGLVFIVGKSGSGKSTMLNILGLLDNYDSGNFLIGGKSTKGFTQKERDSYRAQNIGFIFQEFHIIEQYSIGRNLMLPLEIQQNDFTRRDVETALEKVELGGYFNRKPNQTSGGQKQRVAIARALIKKPQIILADEPTGNLDSVTGAAIFDLLRELSREQLVIVISHDIQSAHRYADTIMELADGEVVGVYPGDGAPDIVKISAEQIDNKNIKQINQLLAAGKQVVLNGKSDRTAAHPPRENIVTSSRLSTKPSHLPLRSSTSLALLSLRARWVRSFFTILVTMFAIAFLAFADMISQYDVNKVMVQEIVKSDLGFVNITSQCLRDETAIFPEYDSISMSREVAGKLEAAGVDFVESFNYTHAPELAWYENYFPSQNYSYYENIVRGVIECDDLSKMGLTLAAGRMPENLNEIIITNFQLESYKRFGIEVSNTRYPSGMAQYFPPGYYRYKQYEVNGWEDVENKTISDVEVISDTHETYVLKIVGLVEYDLSSYDAVANVSEETRNITEEQRQVLSAAMAAKSLYLNKWIVTPGFYESIYRARANIVINEANINFTLNDQTYTSEKISYGFKLDKHLLDDEAEMIYWSGFEEYWSRSDTVKPNQMAISIGIASRLLPSELTAQFMNSNGAINDVVGYTALLEEHLLGKKVKVSVSAQVDGIYQLNDEITEMTVVAIWLKNINSFNPTADFYDKYYFENIGSYILPVSSQSDAEGITAKLSSLGLQNIEINDTSYFFRFIPSTPYSKEIYTLDGYFTIAVTIFHVSAFLFFGFSIILTFSFISASITSRKKDIGILRSLGASRMDVAGIFIIESLIIALIKIILGIVLCYVGFRVLTDYFVAIFGYLATNYQIITFAFRQVVIIIGVTLFAVAVSTVVPIIRIANKQPVDAIR